jgi:hypothetical protein
MARNRKPSAVTAEDVFVPITGIIAFFIGGVLTVITFPWRFFCLLVFLVCAVDFCLRSNFAKSRVNSPHGRTFISLIVTAVIVALAWTPMREQYAQEHLPPALVFVAGGPLGDDSSPVWLMSLHHYGPGPAYNCRADFNDMQQSGPETMWHATHPTTSSLTFGMYPEVDPVPGFGFTDFQWIPRNPNYQRYVIGITCRDGEFEEDWEVVRTDGVLRTRMKIVRAEYFLKRHPDLDQGVFSCADSYVSAHPHLPPAFLFGDPTSTFYPYYRPNHYYTVGVRIEDPGKGVSLPPPPQAPTAIRSNAPLFRNNDAVGDCWAAIHSKHSGDISLPLTISSQNSLEAEAIGCGILILALPIYWFFAFWIMGIPAVRSWTHENAGTR